MSDCQPSRLHPVGHFKVLSFLTNKHRGFEQLLFPGGADIDEVLKYHRDGSLWDLTEEQRARAGAYAREAG